MSHRRSERSSDELSLVCVKEWARASTCCICCSLSVEPLGAFQVAEGP